MKESGISDLTEIGVSQLLEYLGVSQYLQQCDRTHVPYKTAINGWNNGTISFYNFYFYI
jgi:recombinational DNA repair protein (RecF pathway)